MFNYKKLLLVARAAERVEGRAQGKAFTRTKHAKFCTFVANTQHTPQLGKVTL